MDNATRVDFYVLSTAGIDARLFFACRLAEKAYGQNHKVYAHAESEAVAEKLDEMLWTFRQGSFIPHEVLADHPPRAPVCIGTPARGLDTGEVLINLAGQVPAFAKQFTRIAEIVDTDPAVRTASRERFKSYRSMGIEPVTHTI